MKKKYKLTDKSLNCKIMILRLRKLINIFFPKTKGCDFSYVLLKKKDSLKCSSRFLDYPIRIVCSKIGFVLRDIRKKGGMHFI